MKLSTYLIASSLCLSLASTSLAAQRGSAVYEVTFKSTWSKTTHPIDFPSNAHFSPFIGGTHKPTVSFWMPGGIASNGIEVMAETGSPATLRGEVQAAIKTGGAKSVIAGNGLGSTPGSVRVRFTVYASHPLISLTSMAAPSPDWFVGLHGVNLIKGSRWIDKAVIAAHIYDAGTDSGTSYKSPDKDQRPKAKIARVTTMSGPFKGYSTQIGSFEIKLISSTLVYGSGTNPTGSLTVSGEARIGKTLRVLIHDPLASMMKGSLANLFIATRADPGFPRGSLISGIGMRAPGSKGELLIAPAFVRLQGSAWQGKPVPFMLVVPNDMSLLGAKAFAQGALINTQRIGVSQAVEIQIGR